MRGQRLMGARSLVFYMAKGRRSLNVIGLRIVEQANGR